MAPGRLDPNDVWNVFGTGGATTPAAFDTQQVANQRNQRQSELPGHARGRAESMGGNSQGPVDPGDYQNQSESWITGSDEWYGQRNQLGAQAAANSPGAFWSLYGEDVQGWDPAGNASAFMANTFNPQAMGAAMFGSGDFSSVEEVLGGMTGIANQLGGSRAMFVDPAQLVGNVIATLQSGKLSDLRNVNPMLAGIISNNIGNPGGQVQALVSFLGEALGGSMPEDMLSAWMSTIERLGNTWFSQISKGDMKNLDVTSFARFLSQTLGPTLGL